MRCNIVLSFDAAKTGSTLSCVKLLDEEIRRENRNLARNRERVLELRQRKSGGYDY